MKWEQQESCDGYQRLRVEADWSELAVDYDDMVNRHARISLPGFRAGKTPRSVIEQRFHGEIIAALSHRAARRFGLQAVREAGMAILGPAEAEEVVCVKGRPFRALLRFSPLPQIDLPDLGTLGSAAAGNDPRDHISLRLLELVSFDLPQRLIREELGREGSDAEPGSAGWQAAGDRLRLMLILRQIARQEGISVDGTDLQQRIAEKAAEFGTTPKRLQAELEQEGGLERLRDMLLAESTLEYLMERNGQDRQ
ncbi:MAG TPA: trigger factor [Terriglobales bacterium]|nr:trigger factor [Terriglobales bacterium]